MCSLWGVWSEEYEGGNVMRHWCARDTEIAQISPLSCRQRSRRAEYACNRRFLLPRLLHSDARTTSDFCSFSSSYSSLLSRRSIPVENHSLPRTNLRKFDKNRRPKWKILSMHFHRTPQKHGALPWAMILRFCDGSVMEFLVESDSCTKWSSIKIVVARQCKSSATCLFIASEHDELL